MRYPTYGYRNLLLPVIFFLVAFAINTTAYGQVNLQTGSATFSLPMFNWQDHKSNLTTAIGLSYNSGSGLKVNDVASEVGTGWSLIAGGVVTRMQVGEPDDQQKSGSDIDEKDLTKYPNGYLYATGKAYNGCPNALTKYPLYKAKNQLYKQYNSVTEDKQLDYFAFQFNGKSGMFVLNAATYITGESPEDVGIQLGDSKLKIKFQRDPNLGYQGIRTTITSFTIQDGDGLIYKFSAHGTAKLLETKYCDKEGIYYQTQPNFKKGKVYYQADFDNNNIPRPEVINSWYLTEIKDPLTNRIVSLNYDFISINTLAGSDLTYNQESHYSTISTKRSVGKVPRLASIIYPDGHTISFNYGALRADFQGTKPLASVDIKYNNRYVSKYLINTTYFILNRYGNPVTNYEKSVARLCLKSVQKIGVDLKEDSPSYVFDYYTGSNTPGDYVPPPFWLKKDIWGYYNGDNSRDCQDVILPNSVNEFDNDDVIGLCFLREVGGSNNTYTYNLLNAKPGYAKNGLLRQIIYPTGGTLTYDYEQNTGYLNGQLKTVGGVHASVTSSTDGGYTNDCDHPIKTFYNYVLSQGDSSSLWGLEMPLNHLTMSSYYEPKDKKYKWPIISGSLFGSCTYKYMYPGILFAEQATDLSLFMRLMETMSPVLGIVGSVSTVLNAIKIFCASTGVLAIVSLVIDIIVGIYTVFSSCFGNHTKTNISNLYYNYDLNSANPLPAQFKRIEVVENPGTIGKTIHEFTSDRDYPIWELSNLNFSSKQRFAAWAYGLPKATIVVKANGNTVKETFYTYRNFLLKRLINDYDGIPNASGLQSTLISCKCQVVKTSSQKSTDFNDPAQFNSNYILQPGTTDMKVEMNGYYTGRIELISVQERLYSETNPVAYLETTTSYEYTGDTYEISSIATTKSNGETIAKEISYNPNNLNDPVMNTLFQNNIYAMPVSTWGHGPNYQSETRIEYIQLATGAIKPSRILEKRISDPTTAVSYTIPFTEVKAYFYDVNGNLVKVKDEGNRIVSNLYDYDDKYVTATVVNGDITVDKTAYTSFETANLGGWSASGVGSYSNTFKVTGDRAYQLTTGSSMLTASSLSTSISYRLSFWATNPVTLTGSPKQITAAPAINGFTYYEYEYPTGTASVSISGFALIDELRLYPVVARMATVTYDPLIGKTSECDANNRITYYEYDNLGRMRFIKDEKRNIVKMYEYNNVSKQGGCPQIYYSRYTDEIFTRNNCGAGYVGGEYHYIVPANKYTSTISQEDADALVQNELLSQGQAAANNNAPCIQVFCNDAKSIVVYPENCLPGYKGAPVTYTVPAGRYCTTVSKDSANTLALEEIEANAQSYANNLAGNCVIDYDPDWEADENAPTQCQLVSGQMHLFILATNVNPNSSTYNQTQWKDLGPSTSCPTPSCTTANCSSQGPQWRCVYGVCEWGVQVYTASYWDTSMGQYVCIYHYEWSDGIWSGDYYDYGTTGACM